MDKLSAARRIIADGHCRLTACIIKQTLIDNFIIIMNIIIMITQWRSMGRRGWIETLTISAPALVCLYFHL